PGIWIQMHQIIPGKLNVTGVLVPGEPFIVAGHNEDIAWGMTNLAVDDIDLFAETINPENSKQYLFKGEWRDMEVREEKIVLKNGEERIMPLRFTHRGPIISGFRDIKDVELSMRWSGYDMSNEIDAVYRLNRASDWNGFREAVKGFGSVSQNFAYADIDGNIGLQVGGGVAVRKGYGTMIRPGDTDEYDWKGYLSQEQLPYSFNPASGAVSSANNKTVDENYPFYIGAYYAIPYRINRIRQMLDEKEVFGIDDFKRMITDRHSDYAMKLVPMVLGAMDGVADPGETGTVMLNELTRWDYDMSPDLIAPTFFEYYKKNLARNLLEDDIGDLYNIIIGTVRDHYLYRLMTEERDLFVDNVNTPEIEDFTMIARETFSETVKELVEKYGEMENWQWGDIHRFSAAHPLASVKILDRVFSLNSDYFRVGGSNHTVSPYSYSGDFIVDNGASERHIFNPADWDESYTVIPTGISGVPGSEFYLSQTETYCNDGFYREPFTLEAVETAARYRMVFRNK
ncbi:MAG: penicillin acylase family protein, partial [Bacteroidia bacterium]